MWRARARGEDGWRRRRREIATTGLGAVWSGAPAVVAAPAWAHATRRLTNAEADKRSADSAWLRHALLFGSLAA